MGLYAVCGPPGVAPDGTVSSNFADWRDSDYGAAPGTPATPPPKLSVSLSQLVESRIIMPFDEATSPQAPLCVLE